MSGRSTLKTYFLTGANPTEANFADLIDSVLVLSEDLTDSVSTASSTLALSASGGNTLNNLISAIDSRVVTLEGAGTAFASNYYDKANIDSKIAILDNAFNTLPYTAQIADLNTIYSNLANEVSQKADLAHNHSIAEVTNLQSSLDEKATKSYVDNVADLLTQSINAIVPSDETEEVSQLQQYVDAINAVIALLPTQTDFATKADIGHTHTVANITDLSSLYYNKSEVDSLTSSATHTHVESDITDLDKYTTGAVDLKLTDHNDRTDNPHGVTKAQVGLGNVANLSVEDLFQTSEAQAYATDEELQAVISAESAHAARADNPHSVTKTQVGLDNVPNINFQSLLDDHLSADNPHGIDLSFFDVYAKAETDARVQFYLDAFRYYFVPTSATDGAGAIGDLAYGNDNGTDRVYFKFGATKWKQLVTTTNINSNLSYNDLTDKLTIGDGGLTKNNFTDTLKTKLDGIESGAEVNVQADWGQTTTTHDSYINNKPGDATSTKTGLATSTQITKLNGIEAGAQVNVATNLGKTLAPNQVTITSSTGNDVVIGEADNTNAGLMSKTHHEKLDGIASGAEVNVQADWAQANSNHDAYINNKPTIPSGNQIIDWTSAVANKSIHSSNLPAIALSTIQVANSEQAMLGLTTQTGDVVVRSDLNETFIRNTTNTGTGMAAFTKLATPTDAVTSVDGSVGAVTTLQLGTTATTALKGNTALLQLGTTSTTALRGDTDLFSGNYNDLTNKPTLLTLGTTSTTALRGDTAIPTITSLLTGIQTATGNAGTSVNLNANASGGPTLTIPKGDKGDPGDAFTYSNFTQAQLDGLKGADSTVPGPVGATFNYNATTKTLSIVTP